MTLSIFNINSVVYFKYLLFELFIINLNGQIKTKTLDFSTTVFLHKQIPGRHVMLCRKDIITKNSPKADRPTIDDEMLIMGVCKALLDRCGTINGAKQTKRLEWNLNKFFGQFRWILLLSPLTKKRAKTTTNIGELFGGYSLCHFCQWPESRKSNTESHNPITMCGGMCYWDFLQPVWTSFFP